MKVVDVVSQLRRGGIAPSAIQRIVRPRTGSERGTAAHRRAQRWDLAGGAHGILASRGCAKIEKLPLDLRGRGRYAICQARRREVLTVDEARVIDGEEHASQSTRLQHLDVDPFRQHGDLAAADEALVARLRQQRFTDREQHDHHRHAEAVAKEEQHRAPWLERKVADGEEGEHGSGAER